MKKSVPLKKELSFKSNLAQIVSISLDKEFNLEGSSVKGNLLVSGSYKMNDVSVNTEPFSYNIPVNIELSDRYILDNLSIDIDDFYYEIIDNNVLSLHFEIGLSNLEEIKEEEKEKIINPIKYEEEVVEKVDNIILEEEKEDRMEIKEVKTLFDSLDETETFSTYKVCIVKESDTIESIINTYAITRDLLEQYNDISDVKIGDKLIIPSVFDETN